MAKKRIIGLILSSVLTLGIALFSHTQKSNDFIAQAEDELVGTPTSIAWNNVDYSHELEWTPYINDNGVPQQGYCLLPLYPSTLSSSTYTSESLTTANIPGCNVGDYILINGVASKNVTGAVIYGYPDNGFYLYVPHSSVNFSDEYEYVTVEVLEGMSIDGTARTVATRFEYRGLLGSYGNWQINPEPVEMVQGEFSKIDWNNIDYSYTIHQEWAGELTPSGAPRDGYCLLAFFNEVGKTYSESVIGDSITTGRGVIGIGLNVDYKVKVNGVNIVDVEDAICYIYPVFGLFFYIPDSSITYSETYEYPVISIEQGLHFNNVLLPAINFEFRGELGTPSCWTYSKDPSEYNHFDFMGVANGWNNTPADAAHNHSVLQFGEYGVDYLKANHESDATNLVNRYSDCGKKISINGISLADIEEVTVSYIHGFCYVYIALPISVLNPSNGYKVVTLHISEGTVFYDTLLPEVNLYLFNGRWIYERPETPSDSDFESAYSFQDIFGVNQVTLDSSNKQITSSKESSLANFGLLVDYKLSRDSAFVLYALGGSNLTGIRLVFRDNVISLYDATQGNVLLGTAELELFTYDEWFSLLLYTRVVDNKPSIYVAVDDITYIHVDSVNLADKNNIGNSFSINLGDGTASFKNAVIGGDNKKPVLSYSGKSVYGVLTGSDVIDFSNKCSAYDIHDGDVTNLIQYNWPEGAVSNNQINKGIWEVMIVASDRSGNSTGLSVTVVCNDKLDVIVTFDGKNPVNYRIGDHIASVPDPVKEGDGATRYRFVGWYHNDRLWDFENDYVIADMNLVSRFQETAEEYCVTFIVEGLPGVSTYTLFFEYGTRLNMEVFVKDGYSMKAYVGEEEVESITVNENMNVRLVYTSLNPVTPTKKGCGGEVMSMTIVIPLILGAIAILLVVLKKKGGKEHE